jgi:hypothetical protein
MKLSEAQRRFLNRVPLEWGPEPIVGDMRPLAPLLRMGAVEQRTKDVTPADWEPSPVRVVLAEWRITEAGRAAIWKVP